MTGKVSDPILCHVKKMHWEKKQGSMLTPTRFKKNSILSSPTHLYVIPKLYNLFYFLEHKFWRMMVTKQVRFSLIYTIWKKTVEVNENGNCLVTILRNNFVYPRRKKVIQVSNDTGGVNDGLYILYELTQYKSHHGAEVACATAQVKKGQARLQV